MRGEYGKGRHGGVFHAIDAVLPGPFVGGARMISFSDATKEFRLGGFPVTTPVMARPRTIVPR